jgi:hypothetical protein
MPVNVQGVQGHVQGFVQGKTQVRRGLCRVCRVSLYTRARDKIFSNSQKIKLPRVTMYPAHPAHPAQTTDFAAFRCAGYIFAPCTPCTTIQFSKKKMEREEKLICGEDNQAFFRQKLRETLPGFLPALKDLFEAGMIPGLRGAQLVLHPASKPVATSEDQEAACGDCRHYVRDTIGFGQGVGQCGLTLRPALVKWPGTQACCGQFNASEE